MVVDPNDGDKQVAHGVADGRMPQRPELGKRRAFGCPELQHHHRDNDGDHRIRECGHPMRRRDLFTHALIVLQTGELVKRENDR